MLDVSRWYSYNLFTCFILNFSFAALFPPELDLNGLLMLVRVVGHFLGCSGS